MSPFRIALTHIAALLLSMFVLMSLTSATPLPTRETATSGFHVLSYHDIYADTASGVNADSLSVSIEDLVKHFSWLRDNDYQVISISDVIAAQNNGTSLPARSVVLSFDDGYASFHTHILPLLKLFKYPATLAIVGGWIEAPVSSTIEYESDRVDPAKFMSWAQIRDCADSGLVEVASHTFNLHHGEIANPQGNKQPAITTRVYKKNTQQYESEENYRERIRIDLKRNSDLIESRLGKRPRVVVWPYGAYTASASAIASELGMPVGLTLGTGLNDATASTAAINRILITKKNTLVDLVADMQPPNKRSERILTVDTVALFDINAENFERNLSRLLDRIVAIKPRSVIIAAHDQRAAQSEPAKVWFTNNVASVKADVLNRASWQIRTRTGAKVFVELPDDQDAVSTVTLAKELGQYVPLAGIVFKHGETKRNINHSLAVKALQDSQATAESVQRLAWLNACGLQTEQDGSRSIANWRDALLAHNWVLLRTNACNRTQWLQLAALARTLPGAMERTIIEHVAPVLSNAANSDHIISSLEYAHASGFRHLAIAETVGQSNISDAPSAIDGLRRVISIETYPVNR
jgi:poly-beta-1,6-N-acetyl-D-glucosamine N-deacetylase PgaB